MKECQKGAVFNGKKTNPNNARASIANQNLLHTLAIELNVKNQVRLVGPIRIAINILESLIFRKRNIRRRNGTYTPTLLTILKLHPWNWFC
mmetsp:Transcript_53817/g.80320  ORF Transcript_53817/g.80320 Transcript_53817/m.80320 type:complete len:91 (-) Transcript_53817:82-354(-)